jgi:hypothetical protein
MPRATCHEPEPRAPSTGLGEPDRADSLHASLNIVRYCCPARMSRTNVRRVRPLTDAKSVALESSGRRAVGVPSATVRKDDVFRERRYLRQLDERLWKIDQSKKLIRSFRKVRNRNRADPAGLFIKSEFNPLNDNLVVPAGWQFIFREQLRNGITVPHKPFVIEACNRPRSGHPERCAGSTGSTQFWS